MEKKQLLMGDVSGMSDTEVRKHIIENFYISESEIEPYEVLAASQEEESYEGSFYILLKHKESGGLFEVHASHCSCYGYETQFEPASTVVEYLLSEKHFYYPGDKNTLQAFLGEILG